MLYVFHPNMLLRVPKVLGNLFLKIVRNSGSQTNAPIFCNVGLRYYTNFMYDNLISFDISLGIISRLTVDQVSHIDIRLLVNSHEMHS